MSSNTEDQNRNIIPKDPSGIIKTPGYPLTYPLSLTAQCIWKIIAPKGQVIRLDFSSFRMGMHCCLEIELHSINKKSPLDLFECNTKPSFTVYSTGRELGLKLKTYYGATPGPGFIANYTFVPAGENIGFDRFSTAVKVLLPPPPPPPQLSNHLHHQRYEKLLERGFEYWVQRGQLSA